MTPPPTLQELIDTVRQDAGSDQPLDQLVTAAAAAAQLEETTDALLGHFVDRCRRDGRSWSEISAALGVTKQAVHKRFASALAAHIVAATPRRPSSGSPTGPGTSSRRPGRPPRRSAPTPSEPSTCCWPVRRARGDRGPKALAAMNVTEDSVACRARRRRPQDHDHDRRQPAASRASRPASRGQPAAEHAGHAADSPPYDETPSARCATPSRWRWSSATTTSVPSTCSWACTGMPTARRRGSWARLAPLESTAERTSSDLLRRVQQWQLGSARPPDGGIGTAAHCQNRMVRLAT